MKKIIIAIMLSSAVVSVPTIITTGVAEARCIGTTESQVTANGSTEAARGGTCNGSNTYSGAYRRSSGSEQVYIKYSGYSAGSNFNTPATTSSSFQNASLITDTNSSGFLQNCYIATVNDICSATTANTGF